MKKALAVAILLAGCSHESPVRYANARTNELRATFPPGKATRADVIARTGDHTEISLTRPSTGWTLVSRVEKYVSPMTTSAGLTLSHVWYFYDRFDVLVDVEWERMGD